MRFWIAALCLAACCAGAVEFVGPRVPGTLFNQGKPVLIASVQLGSSGSSYWAVISANTAVNLANVDLLSQVSAFNDTDGRVYDTAHLGNADVELGFVRDTTGFIASLCPICSLLIGFGPGSTIQRFYHAMRFSTSGVQFGDFPSGPRFPCALTPGTTQLCAAPDVELRFGATREVVTLEVTLDTPYIELPPDLYRAYVHGRRPARNPACTDWDPVGFCHPGAPDGDTDAGCAWIFCDNLLSFHPSRTPTLNVRSSGSIERRVRLGYAALGGFRVACDLLDKAIRLDMHETHPGDTWGAFVGAALSLALYLLWYDRPFRTLTEPRHWAFASLHRHGGQSGLMHFAVWLTALFAASSAVYLLPNLFRVWFWPALAIALVYAVGIAALALGGVCAATRAPLLAYAPRTPLAVWDDFLASLRNSHLACYGGELLSALSLWLFINRGFTDNMILILGIVPATVLVLTLVHHLCASLYTAWLPMPAHLRPALEHSPKLPDVRAFNSSWWGAAFVLQIGVAVLLVTVLVYLTLAPAVNALIPSANVVFIFVAINIFLVVLVVGIYSSVYDRKNIHAYYRSAFHTRKIK